MSALDAAYLAAPTRMTIHPHAPVRFVVAQVFRTPEYRAAVKAAR